jgi:hypothetical protein
MENKAFVKKYALQDGQGECLPEDDGTSGMCNRQSSASLIKQRLKVAEDHVSALKQMLAIAETMPPQAEAYLWRLLVNGSNQSY